MGRFFSRPGGDAVAVRCRAGAFFTLHGVVFAILGPGSAVQRAPRSGHETGTASRCDEAIQLQAIML
jgi:hypothetical protein